MFFVKNSNHQDSEGKRMKCKACGKELIGKEKLFCRSCWAKGKDTAIKIGKGVGSVALLGLAVVTQKDKITSLFKGGSNDEEHE